MSRQDAASGAWLSLASPEEQRQDDDVINVGRDKQPDRLQDGGDDHALNSSSPAHPVTVQTGSMQGAASSTARVVSTNAVSA